MERARRLTVRQRQQAVKVCAMRVAPSSVVASMVVGAGGVWRRGLREG